MSKIHYFHIRPILFVVCLLTCLQLEAEGIGTLGHMPTPQATDLGRFGDISLTYYTGCADITIPIRSFSVRGVDLNLSLSYDTSGLPVNKLPGWVGPGWTLNAGGVITRIRHNFCDEMTFVGHEYDGQFYNYFHSFESIADNGSPRITELTNPDNYHWHDYSPDVFYFNFMGKTGSFFLGNDGEWKVCSDCNLVVEFDYNNSNNFITPIFPCMPKETVYKHPKAIKGFTIYDDAGNQYIFGGDNVSIEYSIDLFHTSYEETSEPWVATAWYLTSVKDRNGNTLYSFSYSRGKYLVQLYRTPFSASSLSYSGTLNLPIYLSSINVADEANISFLMESPYQAGKAARALYPSLYNGPYGGAKSLTPGYNPNSQFPFYYLQNNDSNVIPYNALSSANYNDPLSGMDIRFLKDIHISSLTGNASVTYNLGYENTGRYHLSSISAIGTDGQLFKHSLKYYNYAGISPDYLTDQHDFWGYYNKPYIPSSGFIETDDPYYHEEDGQGNGEGTQIPEMPIDSVRKPDLNYSMMGMLQEIHFPTGGKTVLDYELNDYSLAQTESLIGMVARSGTAGGLRIKSITEYDDSLGTKILMRRQYSYLNPYTSQSSGQLMENEGQKTYYEIRRGNTLTAQSLPIIQLGTVLGTHIGYSYVKETVNGHLNRQMHFTNYSNSRETISTLIPTSQPEFDPYDMTAAYSQLRFLQGRLLDDSISDGLRHIFQHTKYDYRTDTDVYMHQFSYGFNNILCINTPAGLYPTIANQLLYKLYYPKYDLARVIKSTNYSGHMVVDTTYYSMTTFDQSINDWTAKPYFRKCVSERVARGTTSITKSYTYTPFDRYFIPLTSTSTIENGSVGRTDNTIYSLFNNKPQPQYETAQLGNAPVDTLVTYHSYETNGNIRSFTRQGEYPTQLFWKSNKLVASVTTLLDRSAMNCPNQSSGYPHGDPRHVVELNADSRSIFEVPETQATTYVYNSAGWLISSASGNGLVSYYIYDALGRLTEIQDADHCTLQRLTYNYSTSQAQ